MKRCALLFCFFMITFSYPVISRAQDEQVRPPVSTTIKPFKFETVVGEPVVLILDISNDTKDEIWIDLGLWRKGAITFSISDAQSKRIIASVQLQLEPPRGDAGFGVSGYERIQAGGKFQKKYILDEWHVINRPGEYRIECSFEQGSTSRAFGALRSPHEYIQLPNCETTLKKLPYDEAKIKVVGEAYLSHALSGNPTESSFAADFLAYFSPSVGEPLLLQLVERNTVHAAEIALRYIVDRRAEESVESLVKLYHDKRLKKWMKERMIFRLQSLSHSIEKHPRKARTAMIALKRIGDPWALKQPLPKIKSYGLEKKSSVVTGWQLRIRWRKEYYVNEPVPMELMLGNESQEIVVVPNGFLLHDKTLAINVVDQNKVLVPLTEYGKKLRQDYNQLKDFTMTNIYLYDPGIFRRREVDLSKIFEFPRPGTYYVTIRALTTKDNTRYILREGRGAGSIELPPFWRKVKEFANMTMWPEKINEEQASVVITDVPLALADIEEEITLPAEETSNTLLPILIIAGVILAGLVLFLLLRRKK